MTYSELVARQQLARVRREMESPAFRRAHAQITQAHDRMTRTPDTIQPPLRDMRSWMVTSGSLVQTRTSGIAHELAHEVLRRARRMHEFLVREPDELLLDPLFRIRPSVVSGLQENLEPYRRRNAATASARAAYNRVLRLRHRRRTRGTPGRHAAADPRRTRGPNTHRSLFATRPMGLVHA